MIAEPNNRVRMPARWEEPFGTWRVGWHLRFPNARVNYPYGVPLLIDDNGISNIQ